jgi:hypothetical protein
VWETVTSGAPVSAGERCWAAQQAARKRDAVKAA